MFSFCFLLFQFLSSREWWWRERGWDEVITIWLDLKGDGLKAVRSLRRLKCTIFWNIAILAQVFTKTTSSHHFIQFNFKSSTQKDAIVDIKGLLSHHSPQSNREIHFGSIVAHSFSRRRRIIKFSFAIGVKWLSSSSSTTRESRLEVFTGNSYSVARKLSIVLILLLCAFLLCLVGVPK